MKCPKCEGEIKDEEKICPHCQYDSVKIPKTKKEENEANMKWGFGGLIVIVIIGIICININSNDTTTTTSRNTINTENSTYNKTNATNIAKVEKTKVTVIDFSQMSKEEIQIWCTTSKVKCSFLETYSDVVKKGLFISQSIKANDIVYEGDKITITYSLGKEPTLGQKNALESAKDYIRVMSFSYKGLIKQLKYEGYSDEEATYGADNCKADWNEQAAKSAQNYINTMSFSRSGLIRQLKYEGFTDEQAEYGTTSVGY